MVLATHACCSQEQLLDLVLHFVDLGLQGAVLGMQDSGCDDVARYAASTTEVGLLGHVDVGDVLVFAQKWQVQDDLKWLSVGGEDHKVGNAAVQCLGGLVGSFFQLYHLISIINS